MPLSEFSSTYCDFRLAVCRSAFVFPHLCKPVHKAVQRGYGVLSQLQTGIAAAGRVFEVLEAENETPDSPESPKISECNGNVKIENVCFSYKRKAAYQELFA